MEGLLVVGERGLAVYAHAAHTLDPCIDRRVADLLEFGEFAIAALNALDARTEELRLVCARQH